MDFNATEAAIADTLEAPGTPVIAGSAVAGADTEIDQIIVKGTYRAPQIDSATRTPALLVDVPQSISVISEQQIDDQALRSIADVLRFTPGATIAQGEGHRDQVLIRGQNTTANFFIDGLRDDVQYFRPLYNLERVEVLKGANALAFGRGAGGGVINRVTKTAIAGDAFTTVDAGADTFGGAVVSGDTNVALGERAGLRVNAFYERLENHRDVFSGDRAAINPTLAFAPTDATRVDLSYEYVRDERIVDRGVPSLDGEPLEGFDNTFFGSPDLNDADLTAHIARGKITHALTAAVTATASVQYADYDKAYRNLFPVGFDADTGTVSLDGYFDRTDRQNFLYRGDIVAQVQTGGIGHTILVGVEGGLQDTVNDRRDALFAQSNDDQVTFGFSDPLVIPAVSFPVFNRDRESDVNTVSVYAQDQIDLGRLQIVAGLRYDRFEIDVIDRVEVADGAEDGNDGFLSRTDEEVSPRLGLIYKPVPNASVYASYAKSFLPRSGDQFLTLSLSNEALGPEEFETYELGVKWDLTPGLSLTGAVFEIERDAGTTEDPDNVGNTILIGTRTRGVEAQLSGQITDDLVLTAGYSYLDADEDGRVVGGVESERRLAQVPEHQASVWGRYDVTSRLGLGLGATHQSSQVATIAGAVRLPAFTRIDAAAYYALSDGLELQVNVENLFDTDYFPAAHNANNITTGAPLNARFTVRASF